MKKLMFVALAVITLLTTSSCTKEKISMADMKASAAESTTTASLSLSSTDEPALLLVKSVNLANTTYYVQTNRNKSAEYISQNQFSQAVKIDTVKVYVLSASSMEDIPSGALRNLSINMGNVQYGPTFGNPNISGGANTFSLGSSGFILTAGSTQVFTVYSDFPLNTSFGFTTKMELKGVNMVTGQRVSTIIQTGQTITVVTEPAIVPTFVPSLSSVSQYVACGSGGNEYLTNAVFHFPANTMGYKIVSLKYSIAQQNNSVNALKVGHVNGPFISAPFIAGIATINGMDVIVPPNSAGVDIQTKVWYPGVGVAGLSSGTESTLRLVSAEYLNLTTNVITSVNFNVPAVLMRLVACKPVIIMESLPHQGLVLNSSNKIAEFDAEAQWGFISVNNIRFDITHSGISNFSLSNIRIMYGGNYRPPSSYRLSVDSGYQFIDVEFFSPVIPVTLSKTFSMFADVSGNSQGNTTLSLKLNRARFLWADVTGNGVFSAENGNIVLDFPDYPFLSVQ